MRSRAKRTPAGSVPSLQPGDIGGRWLLATRTDAHPGERAQRRLAAGEARLGHGVGREGGVRRDRARVVVVVAALHVLEPVAREREFEHHLALEEGELDGVRRRLGRRVRGEVDHARAELLLLAARRLLGDRERRRLRLEAARLRVLEHRADEREVLARARDARERAVDARERLDDVDRAGRRAPRPALPHDDELRLRVDARQQDLDVLRAEVELHRHLADVRARKMTRHNCV